MKVSDKPLHIGIVAGEVSGDLLAAGLIKALKKRYPKARFSGVAGENMRAAGAESLCYMEALSVMGLVEVLKHLPRLLQIRRNVIQHFLNDPPDIYIGVDAPDFNLPIERKLKLAGIPTVHYVSPTIWAWREGRVHNIKRSVDRILGIFPFEQAIYNKHQIAFSYVGHSMADSIPLEIDKTHIKQKLQIDEHKLLAILPGSRSREVSALLPDFLQTFVLLKQQVPALRAMIPAVNRARMQQIQALLQGHPLQADIEVTRTAAREVMQASDAVLLASGTASLEAMLCKTPMLVAYKMPALTYQMMKRLYKPDYFALPNILANKALVPELLQEQVVPEAMCELLLPMLRDQDPHRDELIAEFKTLHQTLACNADESAAQAIQNILDTQL